MVRLHKIHSKNSLAQIFKKFSGLLEISPAHLHKFFEREIHKNKRVISNFKKWGTTSWFHS